MEGKGDGRGGEGRCGRRRSYNDEHLALGRHPTDHPGIFRTQGRMELPSHAATDMPLRVTSRQSRRQYRQWLLGPLALSGHTPNEIRT